MTEKQFRIVMKVVGVMVMLVAAFAVFAWYKIIESMP